MEIHAGDIPLLAINVLGLSMMGHPFMGTSQTAMGFCSQAEQVSLFLTANLAGMSGVDHAVSVGHGHFSTG